MRFSSPRRPDPLVDITPMIDIVFQLVLFFMVSTTFVSTPGIQVDLPRSSAQMLQAEDDDINVWIACSTGEGGCASPTLHLGNETTDEPALLEHFRRAAAVDRQTLIVLKADQGVPHGAVVAVMDLANAVGLNRLAIATEAAPSEDDASQ